MPAALLGDVFSMIATLKRAKSMVKVNNTASLHRLKLRNKLSDCVLNNYINKLFDGIIALPEVCLL